MAGDTLKDLPRPKEPYRLNRDTRHADGVVKFRTRKKEGAVDAGRARGLERAEGLAPVEEVMARDLAVRLKQRKETGNPPETLASAVYHREERMRILGNLWPLAEAPEHQPVAFVTLRPTGMLYEAHELADVNPALLVKRLRNDFKRAGVTAASGFALVGLDAEFDANRAKGVWDFHFHGIVGGKKVQALEALRARRKYKDSRLNPLEQGLPASTRLKVQSPLFNLPSPLTYCLESWVPHRPTFHLPDGTLQRSESKKQIPTPDHERWLLWMDRWVIGDFVLLSGIRPSRSGFVPVLPKKVSLNEMGKCRNT